MPRTRSLAWSELKIGVLTIIAVSIAAFSIFMLTQGRGFFWQRYKLKTRFDNVAGLKSGSPVRVAGVEVGLLFMEQPKGGVKVSFRSRSKVDVARLAETFGGGGHQRASGATIHASLEEARTRILGAVETTLERLKDQ